MAPSATHPKLEVGMFLVLVLLLSSAFYGLLLLQPGASQRWGVYSLAFMWCPGVAAIATHLVLRRSLRGLGWGWGGLRYYLLAYSVPIAFCMAAYLPVWLGYHAFRPEELNQSAAKLGLPPGALGFLALALVMLAQPFLGMIGSLGEELGWRGFLVPRLYSLVGFTWTSLITGLIWSVWHYPIIIVLFPLSRPAVPICYALACFTVTVAAISFVHSWLRLRSGSVWPSALFHASGNACLTIFQVVTLENVRTSYLTAEYGLGPALAMLPLGYAFWRLWQKRPQPSETHAAYAAS